MQPTPTQPVQPPPQDRTDVIPLIRRLEGLRKSRVIAYYMSDQALIADDAMPVLYRQLRATGKQTRIDLWVHSRGGATVVPWRMASAIREFCDHFGVLIPYRAHSAATHVAMG